MGLLAKLSARLPTGSLGRRSLSSGLWSLVELGTGHLLRLASNLIMTRLLAPEAFGLMAMVTTIYIGVAMLSDLGIRQSIIRAPDAENATFLRTAWTVQALRGTAIALIVLGLAAAIAVFGARLSGPGTVYADPRLPALVAAYALTVQIEALFSVNAHLAARRMAMGRLALTNISAQGVSIAIMVGIASLWPSVWALLLGGLAGAIVRTGASHIVFPGPRMRPAWDGAVRHDLWQFGKWIIGSSALSFLARNADRLILAALMASTPFGLYVIALLWIQAYAMVASMLSGQVGLPILSSIWRDRPADLPRLFRKYMRAIDLFCIAGFLAFFFGGDLLIGLLYTETYAGAGRFMPLLAVLILAQRFAIFIELMVAQGESFLLMLTNALGGITVCAAIPAGYLLFGPAGAIAASILSPLVGAMAQLVWARRSLGPSVREDWLWIAVILGLTAAILAGVEMPGAS